MLLFMRIYVKTAPRCGIFCLKPLAKTQAVKKPILWAFVAKPQAETLVVLYPANFFPTTLGCILGADRIRKLWYFLWRFRCYFLIQPGLQSDATGFLLRQIKTGKIWIIFEMFWILGLELTSRAHRKVRPPAEKKRHLYCFYECKKRSPYTLNAKTSKFK